MCAGPAASFVPNMLLAYEGIKQKENERKNEPLKVPGEIKRSQRREVELDLQVNPEEIMSREVEPGCCVRVEVAVLGCPS